MCGDSTVARQNDVDRLDQPVKVLLGAA